MKDVTLICCIICANIVTCAYMHVYAVCVIFTVHFVCAK